ncbi:MAG: exo-alpha-sialidase [Armatimonadetes bacterium]|nr:exo-alpha-sialidase [Armatimonadota bacterium]
MLAPLLLLALTAADPTWHDFYTQAGGFVVQPTEAWIGDGTRSEATADGLHVVDETTAGGSGRMYAFGWQLGHGHAAVVEARLRVTAANQPWGCCINVADGANEEDVSLFPDCVRLSYAEVEAKLPAGEGFHTFRIELKAPDIRVLADGKLLIDGARKFTHPVIAPGRDRVAFGASASVATSDATWQLVRFQGGQVAPPEARPAPRVPGLRVRREETVPLRDNLTYANMFRFRSGLLQVADRRSTDNGQTWTPGSGPWVGAVQLPDGEVLQLDYRTHADAEKGWFKSALTRWDADGRPLPTLNARLHVPDLVPFVDDDGSVRDGPWCDHSLVVLRDGSLLAANCGCFAADQTPVSSYPTEFKAHKYRGFVTRSTDRGLTWEYLATVTADPELGSEGCNEMDLIRAPNGDLLCLFRTGGSATQPSPMYQCRSADEGRTWGRAERVADRGVWPNLCLTRDGVLVCTYGRPGNWLIFSLDSGKTWVGALCFDEAKSSSYSCVEEVSPGRTLVEYDRQGFDRGGNPSGGVFGTFFSVARE